MQECGGPLGCGVAVPCPRTLRLEPSLGPTWRSPLGLSALSDMHLRLSSAPYEGTKKDMTLPRAQGGEQCPGSDEASP